MAKLLALSKIILPADEKHKEERFVMKGKVFDATPDQAKQFDAIKAARPATPDEVEKAKQEEAVANGQEFVAPAPSDSVLENTEESVSVNSTASGDPKALPKSSTK